MSDDRGRSSSHRYGPRLAVLACVLLGARTWGQDAGTPEPSLAAVPAVAPAKPTDSGLVVTLHGVPVAVTASSVLEDSKTPGRYSPTHLLDEDPDTLWVEGAKGSGAGEWVELSFPPDTPVHAFLVTPGNPKSSALYKANARPRKARLELRLGEGRRLDYELDFPRDFPAGGAIYIHYRRSWAVQSARLTVLTVWPGSRYQDLCLGGFVPVFRGPEEHGITTFQGAGDELAPTLATFLKRPGAVYELLPPQTSGVSAWLRAYSRIPHNGPLPSPLQELELEPGHASGWGYYARDLDKAVLRATAQSELFRVTPGSKASGYVFAPLSPPRKPDSSSNFRIHWEFIEGGWRVVELDVTYREETPDD